MRLLERQHGDTEDGSIGLLATLRQRTDARDPQLWRCRSCGHPVASAAAAISVAHAHEHDCTNPAGLRFRVRCFARADGCRSRGTPTAAATWFEPWPWNFAHCGGCGMQLGWTYFDGAEVLFFGLLADRLRQDPVSDAGGSA